MDRTKRQAKAARDQARRATDPSPEDEALDLEEVVLQTRERVKAAKAAKARSAALRQELLQLQEEENSIAADNEPVVPATAVFSASAPAPAVADPGVFPASASAPVITDPGALVAATLNSAVISIKSIFMLRRFFTTVENEDN